LLGEREISLRKKLRVPEKLRSPARNQTQDLLQVLLPKSHWCPWQRSGKCIIYRPQQNPADSLSLGGDPPSSPPHADMVVGLWIDCTGTLPEQILSTTSASTGDLHPKRENQVDSAKAYR